MVSLVDIGIAAHFEDIIIVTVLVIVIVIVIDCVGKDSCGAQLKDY